MKDDYPIILTEQQLHGKGFDDTDQEYKDYRENLHNIAIEQEIDHKDKYSKKAYKIVRRWLVFIPCLIIVNGLLKYFMSFLFISDTVMITLIGSTTISVVGLFAIILKGTFNSKLIEASIKNQKVQYSRIN